MLRLGISNLWLSPTAAGWMLLKVSGDKRRVTERFGPFTSPKHVLQQRAVVLPKAAERALKELVAANEAGERMVEEMPDDGPADASS